ncbi:hypothetical protein [Ferribacterium limneticum]|nr:hypothetical protein [Ferribacterium limneticum]UCV21710.1 hypothetical protein KI613_14330 [Ferribacterium limneticum]
MARFLLFKGCASMQRTPAETFRQDRLGQVTVIAVEQAAQIRIWHKLHRN